MTLKESEKINNDILENAIEWANNRECLPLEPYDIIVLGEHYKIRIPQCFYHFICSENVNHVKTNGAEKTIFKTLDKIRKAILNN